jgi:hypothetical protein
VGKKHLKQSKSFAQAKAEETGRDEVRRERVWWYRGSRSRGGECGGGSMYIGPGWHGSNWMGYGHHHLSLSCHERRRKKKLERVALERAQLSSLHLTDSTQGGGEVEAEVVVVVSYLQERGKDGQGKGRLLLFYSFFKLGKRFAFSLI